MVKLTFMIGPEAVKVLGAHQLLAMRGREFPVSWAGGDPAAQEGRVPALVEKVERSGGGFLVTMALQEGGQDPTAG